MCTFVRNIESEVHSTSTPAPKPKKGDCVAAFYGTMSLLHVLSLSYSPWYHWQQVCTQKERYTEWTLIGVQQWYSVL